ncbi:hypothetical protein LWC33_34255, partial [Pseudonocardia sp. RS11V-5]|uniref:hypothetical protein n=1 Tax=Pseudonocardia terrae TaxID=2905831 RepID=UPI001E5A6282
PCHVRDRHAGKITIYGWSIRDDGRTSTLTLTAGTDTLGPFATTSAISYLVVSLLFRLREVGTSARP